jgi:hypothetical protein
MPKFTHLLSFPGEIIPNPLEFGCRYRVVFEVIDRKKIAEKRHINK